MFFRITATRRAAEKMNYLTEYQVDRPTIVDTHGDGLLEVSFSVGPVPLSKRQAVAEQITAYITRMILS